MEDVGFEKHLAFWEERFPGKGATLMEILQPFYGWKEERKPVLPDVEEQAKSAIHWREIQGVRIFKGWYSLHDSLHNSLVRSLRNSLHHSLHDSLADSLWNSLAYSLADSLILPDVNWDYDPLWESLFFACGYILAGKPDEAAKFKPLLNLFVAGNFPLGFDEEGNLLILVAD
ncbi:hypothetical protein HZC53_00605 [Candidatus Uhrbacteria bacterium]|nr:hypothetical protein [Candidatus Uhrbacteria bacterium]